MNKEELIFSITDPARLDNNTLGSMNELVKQFPYCATLRVLHLRNLKNVGSIHFESELKRTALYANDRSVLRKYINSRPALVPKPEATLPEVDLPKQEINTPTPQPDKKTEPTFEKVVDVKQKQQEVNISELSPAEIIANRLREIASTPTHQWQNEDNRSARVAASSEAVTESTSNDEKSQDTIRPEEITASIAIEDPKPAQEPTDVNAHIEEPAAEAPKIEAPPVEAIKYVPAYEEPTAPVETPIPIDEAGILPAQDQETVLPPDEPVTMPPNALASDAETIAPIAPAHTPPLVADTAQAHTFTEWLHLINQQGTAPHTTPTLSDSLPPAEATAPELEATTHDTPPTPQAIAPLAGGEKEMLIEKFIAEEPRIVPSKAEFYSASEAAKNSLIQHEDVCSETLASIYHSQGNLKKSLSMYERLILTYPEKSGYFAAQISELKKLLS